MFSPFMICGSFHHEDEENDPWSLSSTSTKSRRKDTKNPYSMRGLETFAALLADLEEKKQKIYSEIDARNISFVRFVYSNSNDCVPIVVKLKDNKQEDLKTNNTDMKDIHPEEATVQEMKQERVESENKKSEKKRLLTWNSIKQKRWRRPSYYLPAVIILILLLLVFFGRSVAVLCTAIGWYMVPTLKGAGRSSSSKVPKIKKEYVRRMSDVKMSRSNEISSPKGNISAGAFKNKSPPRQFCPLKSG